MSAGVFQKGSVAVLQHVKIPFLTLTWHTTAAWLAGFAAPFPLLLSSAAMSTNLTSLGIWPYILKLPANMVIITKLSFAFASV